MTNDQPDTAPPSEKGNPCCVRVADVISRADWQVRAKIDSGVVRSYAGIMRGGGALPAISLARIGGALYLVDGWHRLEAAKLNGDGFINAAVSDMSEAEAQWAAARANLTHGLPLKSRELRAVFRSYVRGGHHRERARLKSYREIAADLANRVAHTTIRNWMRSDFPAVFAALGGDDPISDVGGHRDAPEITPLVRAKASLDAAAAEARRLSPDDRDELLKHLREIERRVAGAGPWEPQEGLEEDRNPDF